MEHMLNADRITEEYLKERNIKYQRIFLARSDPAMNYGLISLLVSDRHLFEAIAGRRQSRGIDDYPSVHTFTIQSAFKYDNPL